VQRDAGDAHPKRRARRQILWIDAITWPQQRPSQHPLPDRDLQQDPVDQPGRGVRHPAPAARRAEAAPLAGERHQPLLAAGRAAHPQEAVRQEPAVQVPAQFVRDEARQGALFLLFPPREGRD
jgi:hypothetical protein